MDRIQAEIFHWCAICAAPCTSQSAQQWLNHHRYLETGKKAITSRAPLPPGRKSIQVHQACLDVLKLIAPPNPSTDIFPITFDNIVPDAPLPSETPRKQPGEGSTGLDYNLLISWSLPKWAGPFLWSEPSLPSHQSATSFNVNISGVNLLGFLKTSTVSVDPWKGLSCQKKRWHITRSHVLPCDLVSPLQIGKPEPSCSTGTDVIQPSKLINLPDELLLLITASLDDVSIDRLRQTSQRFRSLDLGTLYWSKRTLDSAESLGKELAAIYRTRSCSRGLKPGDLVPGWTIAFLDPIHDALNSHPAADVWQWWVYDFGWRSRRRIWRCAIEAAAAVHFADWLSVV